MDNRKFKRYYSKNDNISYVIEEDLVGWYLIVYKNNQSSQDYLFDTFEEAVIEAENKYGIAKNKWKENISPN